MLKLSIVFTFFIFLFSISAGATDGVTVDNYPILGPRDTSGADATVTFWEIPLWLQLAYISSMIAALLGAINLFPFILGKIKDILENRNREKIYAHIKSNPGTTVRDIVRAEGLNIGTVKYHISMLQSSHKIILKRVSKFVRIFQNYDRYSEREQCIFSAYSNATYKPIITCLMSSPGMTNKQIADHLGISEGGVHQLMNNLLKDEIVSFMIEGRLKKFYLESDVLIAIEKIRQNVSSVK